MSNWNINPESLLKIPGNTWVYWKNVEGIYLGTNDRMADDWDLQTRTDIIGMSDYDFTRLSRHCADTFRHEDKIVMSRGITRDFTEAVIIDNTISHFRTMKMPLITQDNKIAGIAGISCLIETPIDTMLNQLSRREHEILQYVMKGKTCKSIAETLGLSTRTVESYLNNIKFKMHVKSKAEIMQTMLSALFS